MIYGIISYTWITVYEETTQKKITEYTHPDYDNSVIAWSKFRLTFRGGTDFLNKYLKKFSQREDTTDFTSRKEISYSPAHAKAAIIDIKNAIFQRMIDIVREGGSTSYQSAVKGEGTGVDHNGNTMNGFIGRDVLPELLSIGKVGIFIDKLPLADKVSQADVKGISPYLYIYKAEDILTWTLDTSNALSALLLKNHVDQIDEATGLVSGEVIEYRLLRILEGVVEVKIYDASGLELVERRVEINLPMIPFVVAELSESLLIDVADYQIALLNLASSDMNYALKGNFPFYTEQYDMLSEMPDLRQAVSTIGSDGVTATDKPGEAAAATKAKDKEIQVGVTKGRKYPKGLERPGFIAPPAGPMKISMEKQSQLRIEIKELVNLAVTNLQTRASAESKAFDERSLESGLSAIGLELEYNERQIAAIWSAYEAFEGKTIIKYPNNYSLKTDADRRIEAKELRSELPTIPSKTYQQVVAKDIATIMVGNKVDDDTLKKIHAEIDSSKVVVTDPDIIQQDHEAGFVSTATASVLRGYDSEEAAKAETDHANRVARIATAQVSASEAARGNPDADDDITSGKKEKEGSRQTDEDDIVKAKVRGEGQ